jgi:hypothetical protein
MRSTRVLLACSLLLVWAWRCSAADLSKIERTIKKEPAYKTKPRYCLLVFGPEAKTRVWLVFDGDALYVDRNGNGDLTKGKRVEGQPLSDVTNGKLVQIGFFFDVAGITKWQGKDASLKIMQKLSDDDYDVVNLCVGDKYVQTAVNDESGSLKFARRPQDAPVIYFNGPLSMALRAKQTLTVAKEPQDFQTMVGTPGVGKGAFAALNIDVVPKDVHPVAEFEFPNQRPRGKPIKTKVVLTHRC